MNPERILGHLLKSGLRAGRQRKGGFNLGGKAGLGMGALGLAFAAYEHFTDQSNQRTDPSVRPGPAQATPTHPSATTPRSATTPPPLPPSAASPPPPPAPPSSDESQLLIRAMIAAANADGLIDKDEEQRIIESARQSGLDSQDIEYLESEINRPRTMFEIVAGVTTPDLARQVYAASLLAVDIDTEDERNYFRQLANSLHLDDAMAAEIEAELGIT